MLKIQESSVIRTLHYNMQKVCEIRCLDEIIGQKYFIYHHTMKVIMGQIFCETLLFRKFAVIIIHKILCTEQIKKNL